MKTKNWFWATIEVIVWYLFIYYLLFTIKNPVDLWQSAFILLVLAYVGTISCPWMRNTDAWKRMVGKKEE